MERTKNGVSALFKKAYSRVPLRLKKLYPAIDRGGNRYTAYVLPSLIWFGSTVYFCFCWQYRYNPIIFCAGAFNQVTLYKELELPRMVQKQ
jgi:hypothetical protein